MSAYGMADSAQLGILTKALNDYCAKHPLASRQKADRELVVIRVMNLFRRGIEDLERLTAELERVG